MNQQQRAVVQQALDALECSRRSHHYCEDTWYSCPKHEEGCANEAEGNECNCGADEANAQIDAAITALRQLLEQPAPVQKPLFADIIAKHPGLAEELKAMDAAPVQEIVGEVGWAANVPNTIREVRWTDGCPPIGTKLYTTSPIAATPLAQPAAWVGLEKADMPDGDNPMYDHDYFIKGMVWADIKLREKNGY
jgi:hypothetical protein